MRRSAQLLLVIMFVFLPLALPTASHARLNSPQPDQRSTPASASPMTNISRLELLTTVAGSATSLAVAGTHAYVGSQTNLRIFDLAAPASPALLSTYPISVTNVAVAEPFVYLTSGHRILILDVQNPSTPRLRGSYTLPTQQLAIPSYFPSAATQIRVAKSLAYVLNQECCEYPVTTISELDIIDIQNPDQPTLVSRYSARALQNGSLRITDEYAYIAGSHDVGGVSMRIYIDRLEIVDIRNPTAPKRNGLYETQRDPLYFNYGPSALAIDKNAAYQGFGTNAQLGRIDITNPITPTLVSTYSLQAKDIQLADGRAFVAADSAGIRVLDTTTSMSMTLLASADTPGDAQALAVDKDLVYVADGDSGLHVFRLVLQATSEGTSSGGLFGSPFDSTHYSFPAGTFTDPVTLTHTLLPQLPLLQTGGLYEVSTPIEISAHTRTNGQTAQPTQPYSLTATYPTDTPMIASTVAWYWWNGTQWQKEPSSQVDPATHTVTATTQQLGRWAVFGETHQVALPLIHQ